MDLGMAMTLRFVIPGHAWRPRFAVFRIMPYMGVRSDDA